MKTIIYLALLATFGGANLLWWRRMDRAVRTWRGATGWRIGFGCFVVVMLAYVVGVGILGAGHGLPMPIHILAYLWNLMALPAWLVGLVGVEGTFATVRCFHRRRSMINASAQGTNAQLPMLPSRRRIMAMTAAAVAAAPVLALGLSAAAEEELGTFRVRRLTLPIPGLPGDLDGLTIAHVTDVHIGRFLPAGTLPRIIDAVKGLKADIVAFTGDVMDVSQHEISPAIEFLQAIRPGNSNAYAIVEGNHDVSHGADWFESSLLNAGLPLLLDNSMAISVPGRATPIRLCGITWGKLLAGRDMGQLGEAGRRLLRQNDDAAMTESVKKVAATRRLEEFSLLLVHHPHAFDPAAALGFPLTIAGHTHGGQLMLTRNIGAGPIRFRYWSGTHRRGDSQLVINNGVGNWFPLRINAPTEILHLTLRRPAKEN